MANQGAALQSQNNELVKCIEELREKREVLCRSIREEETEKAKIQQDLQVCTATSMLHGTRLSVVEVACSLLQSSKHSVASMRSWHAYIDVITDAGSTCSYMSETLLDTCPETYMMLPT